MSYQDGWAAINLEMPDRIPRTEYSAETHWRLVEQVTGIRITKESMSRKGCVPAAAFGRHGIMGIVGTFTRIKELS